MKYNNIREEEVKNKVAKDYFWIYDCKKIIGNIDFCVCLNQSNIELFETQSLLWAEAKKGSSNIYHSLVQLVLTIGKARTFDKFLPPPFLAAFDSEKIVFIPYNDIHDIFYQNDFNWNVAPSNYESREFQLVLNKIEQTISKKSLLFNYNKDDFDLKRFVKTNFTESKRGISKIRIDKNNFIIIYNKWLSSVKSTIAVSWENAKKAGIIDADFYLADLLSDENASLKDNLYVVLNQNHYELDRKINDIGLFIASTVSFSDNQISHLQFWNKYERPPKEEYWEYIINRRDLLVPQDIRERKGSFFTPQIWVEKSQEYLADVFGEDWQEEYYIWDCAAGTGNLLNGLTNKYNIYASTLDKQDVDVMKDRIANGANLLESHVFQFDFLNDDFSKCPKSLQEIINDTEKRKKLVIYINPPYAEAGNARQKSKTGENKSSVATENRTYLKYKSKLGKASNELYTQFLFRIYSEIPTSFIANFSKLKNLQAPNFKTFRCNFLPKLEKLFLTPADLFDNVSGKFPIGFFIWNGEKEEFFNNIIANVFDAKGNKLDDKTINNYDNFNEKLNNWLSNISKQSENGFKIGTLHSNSNDFQHQNDVFLDNDEKRKTFGGSHFSINRNNLITSSILFAVRKVIPATWLNDRDQFLYPNEGWKLDKEFQNNCLVYTLFSNNIQSKFGINHWIPFSEYEVEAKEKFESHFMYDFIMGKSPKMGGGNGGSYNEYQVEMFVSEPEIQYSSVALQFSTEAQNVLNVGKELWKYYHSTPKSPKGDFEPLAPPPLGGKEVTDLGVGVNASLYDIREYFQGRNESGKMNNKSKDERFNELMSNLRAALKILSEKIEPKVYEYGFLKD